MQAIITKFLPATNFKPSRIKASCERGSIIVSYDSGNTDEQSHVAAADALVQKFFKEDAKRYNTERNPWSRPRVCGQPRTGEYCHVFAPNHGNSLLVEFSDSNDRENFLKYHERAKASDGTVGGLWNGLACSALKRATI